MRLSLERTEARILADPENMTFRFRRADGLIFDLNEPGLLCVYEETDPDTLTWIDWYDLLDRRP